MSLKWVLPEHQILADNWSILYDPNDIGRYEGWQSAPPASALPARVPGVIQELYPDYHGLCWYWLRFVPSIAPLPDHRFSLAFGFVDYRADFWLNGVYLGSHEGADDAFQLNVGKPLKPCEENLLAVRLLNPTDVPIDGIVLAETAHRNKVPRGVLSGSSFNIGGILGHVALRRVPMLRAENVQILPNADTGEVVVFFDVVNETGHTRAAELEMLVSGDGGYAGQAALTCEATPGSKRLSLRACVPDYRLWDIDDPVLYCLELRLSASDNSSVESRFSHRFGFRLLEVRHGYFRLNGRRIFVKCCHTGNHFPGTNQVPLDPALIRQDLIMAKASGFNMVRFITMVPMDEQLRLCDEIGLLVYMECSASWQLADSPQMAERFDHSTLSMILQHRNWTCVAVWGLLNETEDGPVFRHAAGLLEKIRSLDYTRLVLLSSGRWDHCLGTGSLSNPGSSKWEYEWGEEGAQAERPSLLESACGRREVLGLRAGMGDIHFYPNVPLCGEDRVLFGKFGEAGKPVFLSEHGVGSLFDCVRATRFFEQAGIRPDGYDHRYFRRMAERFCADLAQMGFGGLFAFPEDIIRESYRLETKGRAEAFDLIRANPKICGYSITGMLDHGFCGEGLWSLFREWKPGIAETLQDGWADLRWCLFVTPSNSFRGQSVRLRAVLATVDALPPGQYHATLRVWGGGMVHWETTVEFLIPVPDTGEDPPLTVEVFDCWLSLALPEGSYIFAAQLEHGGAPFGGRREFHVTAAHPWKLCGLQIFHTGISQAAADYIVGAGADLALWHPGSTTERRLIVIGQDAVPDDDLWSALMDEVALGSTAILLGPAAMTDRGGRTSRLPGSPGGSCRTFHDWLYHKETLIKPGGYFTGLPSGMLDFDYYGSLSPRYVLENIAMPEEISSVSFALGYPGGDGYLASYQLFCRRIGDGRLVVNTFSIEDSLECCPASRRLLENILSQELARLSDLFECDAT